MIQLSWFNKLIILVNEVRVEDLVSPLKLTFMIISIILFQYAVWFGLSLRQFCCFKPVYI